MHDGVNQHRELIVKLTLMAGGMFAFGFALVPLYYVFCDITGLGGRTSDSAQQVQEAVDESRTVRVEFVASLGQMAPWEFEPTQSSMEVHPGKLYTTQYFAQNLTQQKLTGQAVPSVSPGQAAKHFKKVQCFCFSNQTFAPAEGRDMDVVFMVARELPEHIDTVTLSYTFYAIDDVASAE